MMRFLSAWLCAFAILFLANSASAADFAVNFGIRTPSGYGEKCVGIVSGSISGVGASDWAQNATGCIIPSGTYGAVKTYSKTAGQTYNLTIGASTVDITLVANRIDVAPRTGDTSTSNQLRTLVQYAYTDARQPHVGDSIYLRDGDYRPLWGASGISITVSDSGYAGAGTITNPGAGCTPGVYTNLAAIGGSGTNALLVVTVPTGSTNVAQVHINDPGINYVNGDVISAAVPGCSTPFQYTIANLAAEIVIRSETPDATTDANGNPRRGGGAVLGGLRYSGTSVLRQALLLEYLDFIYATNAAYGGTYVVGESSGNRYGMSTRYNHFENTSAVLVPITWRGLQVAKAEAGWNHFSNYQLTISQSGYGSTPTTYPTDTTIIENYIHDNIIESVLRDGIDLTGLRLRVTRNFIFNFIDPGDGGHHDGIQHFGFNTTWPDQVYQNFGSISENIIVRGPGQTGDLGGQGVFLDDTAGNRRITGATIERNVVNTAFSNGGYTTRFSGQQVRFNLTLAPMGAPNIDPSLFGTPHITAKFGEGGLFDRNVSNSAVDAANQTGAIVTNTSVIPKTQATYLTFFPNYNPTPVNWDQAVTSFSPLLNGPAKLADGTYYGPFFPDGSWNDGSVYGQTPATALTSYADTLTVQVGQPVTITVQANADATLAITATPGLSGITGSFSPTTAVITTGQSSAQHVFTPTSAGVATVTYTNNRGLSNPTPLVITVTGGPTPPTAYTQVASRALAAVGSPILIVYTLNQPATQTVTITPGVTGINGVFSQANVVIAVGQISNSVTFFPSTLGVGTLTATDDRGLIDPTALPLTVVRVTRGQLCRLKLC